MFCTGLRAGYFVLVRRSLSVALAETAAVDQLEVVDVDAFLHRYVVALGDIEPGEMPPTSAWCPREATQNRIDLRRASNTGVQTVMSGRCVPPL